MASEESPVRRPLVASDIDAVMALVERCLAVDGGHREMALVSALAACDVDGGHRASQGLFRPEGLAGYATVRKTAASAECRLQIDPAFRGKHLEDELMEWCLATAARINAAGVTVATEGLTDEADRLYRAFGLVPMFAEDVMRLEIPAELPATPVASGITMVDWAHAEPGEFFQVYDAAFRERPGFPGWSAGQWTTWAAGDDDFLPGLSLVARDSGTPVAFIICATGWVVQMGVHPEARRRGLGRMLLTEVARRFWLHGASEVWLDVNVNNPSAAALYTSLGFQSVGRRARYAPDPNRRPPA